MAKIKNTTGEDRILPWLNDRLVLAGQVVDVPDADVYAYTQQVGWEPADEAARAAHSDAEPDDGETLTEPAGNASREDWAAWVVATERATDADLADKSRDEIRDTYKETL
jgi:hypothetical protein